MIVTAPVAPDTVTLVPATIDVTPEFVTVGVVVPETLIPVPAVSDCTPVALTVNAVVPETLMPVPAVTLFTPVADTVREVVPEPLTLMPVPPETVGAVIVTAPVDADTDTPVPARLVTPLFVTVKLVV